MSFSPVDLLVVIPCLDEVAHIGRCLGSLLGQRDGALAGRIIVVDGGSTDGTVAIVTDMAPAVRLISCRGLSISGMRNLGATSGKGAWLAFVDADVEVGVGWLDAIALSIERHQAGPGSTSGLVAGSPCGLPQCANWLEKTWYEQLLTKYQSGTGRYVNSGNLITDRMLFERIGGFDVSFKTAEDVKYSRDAVKSGARISIDHNIVARHHGYPRSSRAFVRRELWHGMGMARDLKKPWRSRPLALAMYNCALVVGGILHMGLFDGGLVRTAAVFGTMAIAPLTFLTVARAPKSMSDLARLHYLFLLYSLARTAALLMIACGRPISRRTRS